MAAKRMSAANLEWMQEFEIDNNEFMHLGEPVFKVEPVEKMDKDKGKPSKAKPYDRPPKSSTPVVKPTPPVPEKLNRAYIEIPTTKPHTILKRPDPAMTEPTPMQIEPRAPVREKGKQRENVPETSKSNE